MPVSEFDKNPEKYKVEADTMELCVRQRVADEEDDRTVLSIPRGDRSMVAVIMEYVKLAGLWAALHKTSPDELPSSEEAQRAMLEHARRKMA